MSKDYVRNMKCRKLAYIRSHCVCVCVGGEKQTLFQQVTQGENPKGEAAQEGARLGRRLWETGRVGSGCN